MTTWPEPSALELLVSVAEHGSLGAAARRLGVSQPSASRSVGRLERTLGLTLLTRTTTGSSLTSAGVVAVDWAREVLDAYERLREGAAALAGSGTEELRVGASQTVAEHLLPAWLATLRREHPTLSVTVEVHNSAEVWSSVLEGRDDLGFVEGPGAPPGVHALTVAHDQLVLVVAPGHPWARRTDPVQPDDLLATPLVTREPGSGTRVALDDALGRPAPVALAVGSNAAVRVAVMAGAGPAVLSRLAVADAVAAGQLVAVPLAGLALGRSLRAVWHGPRRLTGAAAALVDIARTAPQRGPGSP